MDSLQLLTSFERPAKSTEEHHKDLNPANHLINIISQLSTMMPFICSILHAHKAKKTLLDDK